MVVRPTTPLLLKHFQRLIILAFTPRLENENFEMKCVCLLVARYFFEWTISRLIREMKSFATRRAKWL